MTKERSLQKLILKLRPRGKLWVTVQAPGRSEAPLAAAIASSLRVGCDAEQLAGDLTGLGLSPEEAELVLESLHIEDEAWWPELTTLGE